MKSAQSEKGNVIELVIIGVLALAIIGLLAWRFIGGSTTKDASSVADNSASSTTQTADTTPASSSQITKTDTTSQQSSQSAEPDASGKYSADQVTSHVQSTYATYIELRGRGDSIQESLQAVAGAFTEAEYATLKNMTGIEGLTCAANYVPESVQVTTTISGTVASSKVTRVMSGQTASAQIIVLSDLSTNTITSVQCPQ